MAHADDRPTDYVTPSESDGDWRTIERFDDSASVAQWAPRNDNIMGGRSDGSISFDDGVDGPAMVFEGALNLDGGGFASIRRPVETGELAGATEIRISARTDGRRYRVSFKDDLQRDIDRVSHQAVLRFGEADSQGVAASIVDLGALETKRRGRAVEAERFRPELAASLGIMITDDNEDPFRLAVVEIAVR